MITIQSAEGVFFLYIISQINRRGGKLIKEQEGNYSFFFPPDRLICFKLRIRIMIGGCFLIRGRKT